MKKLIIIFAIVMGLVVSDDQIYANQTNIIPSIDQTDVVYVSDSVMALVDHINNKVDLVDLITNRVTNISNDTNTILDVSIMKSPQKIILLKKVTEQKISKTVLAYNGNPISKTEIALQNTGGKIKWVAPTGKVNERIMVQSNNSFKLYQYPWIKPSVSYNAKIVDKGYESISVMDWAFEGYPNLAIKYQAQGIMSDDFFVKTVNLYTKNETLFKDFNTDLKLKYTGTNLAIFTSYTYQAVPGNAVRPLTNDSQKIFRLIDNSTGKETFSIKDVFKEEGDLSGWRTELINGQLFVGNLLEHTWSLFSQNGNKILINQDWPENGSTKFLFYNLKTQTAYFLDYSSGGISIITSATK